MGSVIRPLALCPLLLNDGSADGGLWGVNRPLVKHGHEAAAFRVVNRMRPGVSARSSRMAVQFKYLHDSIPDRLSVEYFRNGERLKPFRVSTVEVLHGFTKVVRDGSVTEITRLRLRPHPRLIPHPQQPHGGRRSPHQPA